MEFFTRHRPLVLSCIFAFVIVLAASYEFLFAPPVYFPLRHLTTIENGEPLVGIASQLGEEGVIKHPRVLRFLLTASGMSRHIKAGDYLFQSPQNVFTVAYRLAQGDHGITAIRVTFPEGSTLRDIARKLHETFPHIHVDDVLSLGKGSEGYYFPDTYFILPNADATSTLATMRENFNDKTAPFSEDIERSGHSLSEIVTLASLVEKEARDDEDRKIVAGILWNRLQLGMPLQVDAVFGYIFDRETYSPSLADLEVDSPYNTYLHTGLPPGAICNPGAESILAALHPAETKYLYYLTDKDGVMHYATTYAEHQVNQNTYLN